MILYTLGNKPHPDKNDTSLGWQRRSISGVGLESSAPPQYVASLDPRYRLVCHLNIQ